jgi:hypothetical protein
MNHTLPPGDCGNRKADPKRAPGSPGTLPRAFGLVGGVAATASSPWPYETPLVPTVSRRMDSVLPHVLQPVQAQADNLGREGSVAEIFSRDHQEYFGFR